MSNFSCQISSISFLVNFHIYKFLLSYYYIFSTLIISCTITFPFLILKFSPNKIPIFIIIWNSNIYLNSIVNYYLFQVVKIFSRLQISSCFNILWSPLFSSLTFWSFNFVCLYFRRNRFEVSGEEFQELEASGSGLRKKAGKTSYR